MEPKISIRWRAFELRPEPVPVLDPEGKYLTEVWRDHVYPLAEKMHMPLRKPSIQPRTRLAHIFSKWAEEQPVQTGYNVALFSAFLQYGMDISKIEILEQIARELYLPAESLRELLKEKRYSQEVSEDVDMAKQISVRAVPSFVLGSRFLAAGVQTASRLQELIKRAFQQEKM